MQRIATLPMQQTIADAMQRAQTRLGVIQAQLASGRKANDFAGLGNDGPRLLSAHSMVAREDAYRAAAQQVSSTLSIQGGAMDVMDGSAESLRQSLLTAIGTGRTAGLQETIEGAFDLFRSNLNANARGVPTFGGGAIDGAPFRAGSLQSLVGTTSGDVFANGSVRASTVVGEGVEMTHGLLADEVGTGLYEAFRTLAEAGPIGEVPTAAQAAALSTALGQFDAGLAQLRDANAGNGRRQAQVETIESRSQERSNYLGEIITKAEDADLSDIAIDLAQQKTALEASYSVYSQLTGLSLLSYLK